MNIFVSALNESSFGGNNIGSNMGNIGNMGSRRAQNWSKAPQDVFVVMLQAIYRMFQNKITNKQKNLAQFSAMTWETTKKIPDTRSASW